VSRLQTALAHHPMRPTPFRAVPPRSGRQWTVVDADGKEVCECDGLEDGAAEAALLVRSVNLCHPTLLQQACDCFVRVKRASDGGERFERLLAALRVRIIRRAAASDSPSPS
jgi:hypothetical protein